MNADFLVKLRDAAQLIADAANEALEKMAPSQVKYSGKDFDKLFWEDLEGTKGPYHKPARRIDVIDRRKK